MLKIYLARHGQDLDNLAGILNGHRDESLSDKGAEQAHEIANKIKDNKLSFDVVFSSPLKRARKTADIISMVNDLPVPKQEDLLIERNFGVMTGKKVADIEKLCAPNILKTEIITYFIKVDGAETFPDMMVRARKLIDKLEAKYLSGSLLLVTHGDIGKMIYAEYYHLDWEQVLRQFHFGNCELLLMSPDSKASEAHIFKIEQHNH